jgi:transposase
MPEVESIDLLGGWEGYLVERLERFGPGVKGPKPQIWVHLSSKPGYPMQCDGCGSIRDQLHDVSSRVVRDLPLFDALTFLVVPRRRVLCPRCGPRLERLAWLPRFARVTDRLARSVSRLCSVLSIQHAAEYFDLGWDTVKAIDKAALVRQLGKLDLRGLQFLAIDEFALHKGQSYATVIIEPYRREVLWVGRGRSAEEVRPFFELLGPARCAQVKAVAMDMSKSYTEAVKANCPQAELVFDLFHVAAKYGREVIDRVRVDVANQLRSDKKARKVVKGARWLLLRNRETVKKKADRVKLAELLKANRALLTVYVLKDDLKHLWDFRSEGHARSFWKGWYSRAVRSRLEPLKKFARKLKPHLPGILSHCRYPLHTSVLEGINNKIKVIKRMAYGFRDDAYFFLKIRAAFPGNPG